ncbi:MAG TPA: transporter substrate-binding domain-containing protein [Candidatus Polarisedimenticolaceae bacterium]|nr:transporter substrate-binding domain-containing protein [Candidatus Polarisedimenticolaceae bacterium]
MSRITGGIAVALVGRLALPAGDEARLRLASDAWPPFTDVAGETRLALDLVHKALERAGVAAETTIVSWNEATAGLRDGEFDGSAAIWHDAERERRLLYSEPYLENRLVLVGKNGSDVGAGDLPALAGKRIAVVDQYAYGAEVDDASGPLFVGGPSDQANLARLLAGEVDYMLVDELLIRYLVEHRQQETAQLLEIGRTPLVRRPLHFAVRRELAEAQTIVAKFNAEIRQMLADGSYNVILALDWIRADVDGDGRPELVPRESRAGTTAPAHGYDILSSIPREPPVTALDRYWIDGRVYDGWEQVPDRYKTPPRAIDEPPPALLRF